MSRCKLLRFDYKIYARKVILTFAYFYVQYINFRIPCPYNRSGIRLLLRVYQFPDSMPVMPFPLSLISTCNISISGFYTRKIGHSLLYSFMHFGQNNFHYVPYAILMISSIPASSIETSLIFFCFERSAMISAAVVSFFINLYLAILPLCSIISQRSCDGASSS